MNAPASHEPTVDDLRRESERSRADLTQTVSELQTKVNETAADIKERISPAHIKAEISTYVRESRESLTNTIERKIREQPLQAIAIGAGIAYPLWGILRAIPAPILLIGAGLVMSKKMGGAGGTDGVAGRLSDAMSGASDRARDAVSTAQRAVGDQFQRASSSASDAADAVQASAKSAADAVQSRAKSLADDIGTMATDANTKARQLRHDAVTAVQDRATAAFSSASETAGAVRDSVTAYSTKSRDAVFDVVDRNPLLVAGMGLALGAFIAASLPASDAENKVMGAGSDEIKKQARKAAARGVDEAKDAASRVVDDVAEAAEREGLSPDGLRKAVAGVIDDANAVVDRGLHSALGDRRPDQAIPHNS